jgi:hypothetical protein
MTVDRLRVDPRLQKEAAGRVLFCDEASFLDNARAEWLLTSWPGPSLPGWAAVRILVKDTRSVESMLNCWQ